MRRAACLSLALALLPAGAAVAQDEDLAALQDRFVTACEAGETSLAQRHDCRCVADLVADQDEAAPVLFRMSILRSAPGSLAEGEAESIQAEFDQFRTEDGAEDIVRRLEQDIRDMCPS